MASSKIPANAISLNQALANEIVIQEGKKQYLFDINQVESKKPVVAYVNERNITGQTDLILFVERWFSDMRLYAFNIGTNSVTLPQNTNIRITYV